MTYQVITDKNLSTHKFLYKISVFCKLLLTYIEGTTDKFRTAYIIRQRQNTLYKDRSKSRLWPHVVGTKHKQNISTATEGKVNYHLS